jgi:hypothetical protein
MHEVAGKSISTQIKIGKYDRKRFLAKVSLAAGYFIYGELFRNCVHHDELRALMNISSSTEPDNFNDFVGLRGYDEFSRIEDADKREMELQSFFCRMIKGSCVIAIPGPQNVAFVVGILGKWVGMLNVLAVTESFPVDGEHDLGHVIALTKGKLTRMSYRQLAQVAHNLINRGKTG